MARTAGRRFFSARNAALRAGSACASLALLLLCLFVITPAGVFTPNAHAAPASSPTATYTPTTPTATPNPPPNLALVSPSSGQGPVGARITLAGANWTVSSVTIGVALATASCDTPASYEQTIGFVAPQPTGALEYAFTWPVSLPPHAAPYVICAFAPGLAPASVTYQVRSALPPTLSLSDAVVAPGQIDTISGTNFFGASSVEVSVLDPAGVKTTLEKPTPAADGSFSITYTPKPTDLGLVTVLATSPVEGGALPALEASVTVNVQSEAAPTTAPRPTFTPVIAPTNTPMGAVASSRPSLDLRAGLVVALVLALLALAGSGLVIFFRLRAERQRGEELARRVRTRGLLVAAGKIGDLESDTDPSMLATGGQRTTRRFPVAEKEDGEYESADTGWDEDEGPGPDWLPRPMTGSRPILSDESYPRADGGLSAEADTDATSSADAPAGDTAAHATGGGNDSGATVASDMPLKVDE